MIGKRPNAAPSSAGVERLPDRHRVDDDRDDQRDAQRGERGPVRLHLQAAEQHEQRHQRQRGEDRARDERVADRVEYLLVHRGSPPVEVRFPPGRTPGALCDYIRADRARRALRHLLQRHAVPGDRAGGRRAARAARVRGGVPEEQTCCGQMHGNTGYAEHGDAAGASASSACSRATRRSCRPSASCAGVPCASTCRRRRASFELTEFLVDELGVEDVGASFPHRVTYHPTCHSLRLLQVGDRPLRLLRAVRGIDLVELPDARRVLRLRRHVRGQERRHVDGDALRQAAPRARHARGGLRVGRQLVPDAHRRRAAAAARRRAHVHLAEILAAHGMKGVPGRRARDAAGRAAAPQPRQGDDDDPRQAAAGVARAAGLGGAARRRRGDQGARDGDAARAARAARGVGHARRRRRALGARRRRGERDRRRHRRAPTARAR